MLNKFVTVSAVVLAGVSAQATETCTNLLATKANEFAAACGVTSTSIADWGTLLGTGITATSTAEELAAGKTAVDSIFGKVCADDACKGFYASPDRATEATTACPVSTSEDAALRTAFDTATSELNTALENATDVTKSAICVTGKPEGNTNTCISEFIVRVVHYNKLSAVDPSVEADRRAAICHPCVIQVATDAGALDSFNVFGTGFDALKPLLVVTPAFADVAAWTTFCDVEGSDFKTADHVFGATGTEDPDATTTGTATGSTATSTATGTNAAEPMAVVKYGFMASIAALLL